MPAAAALPTSCANGHIHPTPASTTLPISTMLPVLTPTASDSTMLTSCRPGFMPRTGQLVLLSVAGFVAFISRWLVISRRYHNCHTIFTKHAETAEITEIDKTDETTEIHKHASLICIEYAEQTDCDKTAGVVEHVTPGALEIRKAIAATQTIAQAAFDLRLKLLAAHHDSVTNELDDMSPVGNAALRLAAAADAEVKVACNAAVSIKHCHNVDLNHAERVAKEAIVGRKRAHDLANIADNDYNNLRKHLQDAALAEYHANCRAKDWKVLAKEQAKRAAPTTSWLKRATCSKRHVRFADD
ncbi:hypothetical protein GGI13_006455 [Coemansia sp. RSA 455]|nr:hypothetical protein GGI13_006455 [Coemansia sp. RSA 455]